jgi:excinuclease UvrABC nuclease subunit
LVNTKSFIYNNFNKKTLEDINKKLGKAKSEKPVPGIYIFTHIPTGNKYVGSSNNLSRRINEYFKG